MNLKKTKRLLGLLVYLMILLLLAAVFFAVQELYYVCIGAAVVYILLYMKLWRCPHCGAVLGRSGGTLCPNCEKDVGVKLRIP